MAELRRTQNESAEERERRVGIEVQRAREISDGRLASLAEQWEVRYACVDACVDCALHFRTVGHRALHSRTRWLLVSATVA